MTYRSKVRLPCGHWVYPSGDYPQRCYRCEETQMVDAHDPYRSRREPR